MYSIIIDIETLDTSPTSVITEIGVLVFDRSTLLESASFSTTPCVFHQLAAGRSTSPETIAFHQKNRSLPDRYSDFHPKDASASLRRFIQQYTPRRIWIQGPDFDRPIIENFCNQLGDPLPWEFWRTRDTRTLWDLAMPGVKHSSRPHHALPDCRATLADMHAAFSTLNLNPADVA